MVKHSGKALQDTVNTISSTAKKVYSIFYQRYPCTYKNQYSNSDWLLNYKYNRGKTTCMAKLCKKLDRMHVTPGAHANTCLMKIDQVTIVKIGVLVPDISKEMKIMVDHVVLKNLFTTLSSIY